MPPPTHNPVPKPDPKPVAPFEGFVAESYRIIAKIRDPKGTILCNEGRESAGMRKLGDGRYAITIRTIGGFYIDIELNEDALADHRDRVSRMLAQAR